MCSSVQTNDPILSFVPPPLRFQFCPECATGCADDGWCPKCGRVTLERAAAPGEELAVAGTRIGAGRGDFVAIKRSWRVAGGTTYSLRGRIVWTIILLALVPGLLTWPGLFAMVFYTFIVLPWGLRDVWRRETRIMLVKR